MTLSILLSPAGEPLPECQIPPSTPGQGQGSCSPAGPPCAGEGSRSRQGLASIRERGAACSRAPGCAQIGG